MDFYTFKVDQFTIFSTRSPSTDTLHLFYAAFVNGDIVAQKLLRLGDLDSGNGDRVYHPDDLVSDADKGGLAGVVLNDPMSMVAFNFQLLNAGNVPAGALTGRVASTADQMAGIASGLAAAGATSIPGVLGATATGAAAGATPLFWAAIALEGFATLWSWLNVDCDGPVAVDQVSGPRYVLDAWTDTAVQTLQIDDRAYPGIDSPTGCGPNSSYSASWSLSHMHGWARVTDVVPGAATVELAVEHGVGAATHNGAVYALGVDQSGNLLAARSFTGATWSVLPTEAPTAPGSFELPHLPVSAVSFNDRLYVLGIQPDGSITTLAYTSDGGSWTQFNSAPGGLQTEIGIATTVFRHRLYVIAKDSSTGQILMTSTDDLVTWAPWTDVPQPLIYPNLPAGWTASSLAAATLGDALHIFVVYSYSAPRAGGDDLIARAQAAGVKVLLHNSTLQGSTWAGWREVERGTKLKGGGKPLDVAAVAFQGRIYIASRWDTVELDGEFEIVRHNLIAVNFSEDADNWSGWRIPPVGYPGGVPSNQAAGTTAALAGVGNHLYIFAPDQVERTSPNNGYVVWVH